MKKTLLAILSLALTLIILAGCAGNGQTDTQPSDATSAADVTSAPDSDTSAETAAETDADTAAAETTQATVTKPDVPASPANITVLSGTTGMGMAKLICDSKTENSGYYNFTVVSDATQISAGIIGGSIDIAAVPTNLASTLYKKTAGKVQVLAINTLGVLYLLENGETVNSVADLKGKTVYLPGQGTNPEYILKYIIEKNGLTVGTDVIFDYTYNSPDTLATAATSGLVSLALLPEPKVTVVKSGNASVRTALDLTAEWNKVATEGSLAQGCIIVRKDFADQNPQLIAYFLQQYKASVEFVNASPDEASQFIAEAGIIPKAALAKKAIPNCNIVYIDGDDMKKALSEFYKILYDVEPKSIGGAIPDDGIYYSVK